MSDLFDLCSHDLCLHNFDLLQESPTHVMSQIRTSKRHNGLDADLQWRIGLEKARNTLNNTTQMNVRSALLPLTRRCRTDLLSQRIRRLNTRFYTDNVFKSRYLVKIEYVCTDIHGWQCSGVPTLTLTFLWCCRSSGHPTWYPS